MSKFEMRNGRLVKTDDDAPPRAQRKPTTEWVPGPSGMIKRTSLADAIKPLAMIAVGAAFVVWLFQPADLSKHATLEYTWLVQRGTVIVAADMTLTNRSDKPINQALTVCTIKARNGASTDAEGGVLNGRLLPGETRTWHLVTIGSAPSSNDDVTAVHCSLRKLRFDS